MLDILIYLHSLNPPVIHRDIKPQNIICSEELQIYLVDFGAVQAVYRNTISISGTFAGTIGYMSPEQLRGNVVPASDLYSLGCSLVFLLTKKLPTELPQKRMKLDFQSQTNISSNFADWLDKLLEPALEDRFESAEIASIALAKKGQQHSYPLANKAISDRIFIKQRFDSLQIDVASEGARGASYLFSLFGLVCISFGSKFLLAGAPNAMLIVLAGTITLAISTFSGWYQSRKRTRLKIAPHEFSIQWTTFSFPQGLTEKQISGATQNIDWVNINIDVRKKNDERVKLADPVHTCAISVGDRLHKFGEHYDLSRPEVEWLTQEVSAFVKQIRR